MKPERDPETGWTTTGHEWNGITELNTPVPKLVWFFLIVTALFAVGYWLLMPAFPLGSTFTKGLLGSDDRAAVTASVKQAAADRAVWTGQIAAKSYAEIERDPLLRREADAQSAPFGRRERPDVHPPMADLAVTQRQEAVQQLEQRALAHTVAAQHAEHLTGRDSRSEPADDHARPVATRDAGEFEDRHGRHELAPT